MSYSLLSYRRFLPPLAHEWSPLPADYPNLTSEGKRQARVAVCSNQSTPEHLVQAWLFFRNYYLRECRSPSFYRHFVPSPPFHYQLVHDLGSYARNIQAAPRGGGKSTIIGKEIPLLMLLTRPNISISLCLATDRMVEARVDQIMAQLSDNPLILADFGNLKPARGLGVWNRHNLRLANHAKLSGYSVESKKRGDRPDLFILDDPEFDLGFARQERAEKIRQAFEELIFKVVLGMLEEGTSCFWIGTVISRSSFLWYALTSGDSRFEYWNKRIYDAEEYYDEATGAQTLLWESFWPKEWLERRRQEMGSAAYAAEMRNRHVSSEERLLRYFPNRHGYRLVGSLNYEHPANSDATVIYETTHDSGERREEATKPLSQLLSQLFVIMTVDSAYTVSPHSDLSVLHVMGYSPEDVLWSLDLWGGRVPVSILIDRVMQYGHRWSPRCIVVEDPTLEQLLSERIISSYAGADSEWRPRIVRVHYARRESAYGTSKAARMAALAWRFESNKIRLPEDRRHSNQHYKALFYQIENFTLDLALLEHDDYLDTLAMGQFVMRNRRIPQSPLPAVVSDFVGVRPSGIPALSGVNASELPPEAISKISAYIADARWAEAGSAPDQKGVIYEPVPDCLSDLRVVG